MISPIVVMLQMVWKMLPELSTEGLSLLLLPMVMTFSTNSLMMTEEHRFHEMSI